MKSPQVAGGDTALANQYNALRDDAKASSYLIPHQQSTPDLTLKVEAGQVYFGILLVEFAGGNSPTFTAPSANPRIDVLSLNRSGVLVRTVGEEAASPSAPAVSSENIPICQIYNRVGQTSIKDADDSVNGYIYKDLRPHLQQAKLRFGGNGSDGDLIINSGTTTIDVGGAQLFIKNYRTLSITGTGKLVFTNPHINGTLVILKCQGNVVLTSSQSPMIDCSGMGGAAQNFGTCFYGRTNPGNDGTSNSSGTNGAMNYLCLLALDRRFGCGAGGGRSYYPGTPGRGGGALIIECNGSLNFTTYNGISVAGQNATQCAGGGGGGSCVILYRILVSSSGTVNISGGVGNPQGCSYYGGSGSSIGPSGGDGASLIAQINSDYD